MFEDKSHGDHFHAPTKMREQVIIPPLGIRFLFFNINFNSPMSRFPEYRDTTPNNVREMLDEIDPRGTPGIGVHD